ncbi:MAG TPA: SDR family oxidoreductase [Ktedonobacterales bacterium]|nr:SDR family oxidoreductase [Ktedonobacterales bacterium]
MADSDSVHSLFDIRGKVAVVVGGSGALGGAIARGLGQAGARVAIMGRRSDACERVAAELGALGAEAIAMPCDALDRDALTRAAVDIEARLGQVDILVNAAGGNDPRATTTPGQPFFELDPAAIEAVFANNMRSVTLPCQVFGRGMARRGSGAILNIASMSALRPLTQVGAYGAAKAAVVNFTQWLATYMAQQYGPGIRVNALAPGFFLTEQNRFLLFDAGTKRWTSRGQTIVAHTPMGRLGEPDDLIGAALWLVSPAAAFVTGIVVPVDGGFSAYSGV